MGFDVKNKKCAVCEAYLFEDDDVVCCPVCGAPHHRDCYTAVGHCGLEKYHGTDLQYDPQEAEETKKEEKTETSSGKKGRICTQCGKEYPSDARFCPYCGYSEMTGFFAEGNMRKFDELDTIDDNTDIGEGVTAKEASEVILVNNYRYITKFTKLNEKQKKSWNWAAFILPAGWFAYRKMYKESVIAVIFSIISAILTFPFSLAQQQLPTIEQQANMFPTYIEDLQIIGVLPLLLALAGIAVGVLLRLFSSFFGDWLYKKRVIQAVKEIRKADKELDSEEAEIARKKWSGISFIGFMVAVAAMQFIPFIILPFIM